MRADDGKALRVKKFVNEHNHAVSKVIHFKEAYEEAS